MKKTWGWLLWLSLFVACTPSNQDDPLRIACASNFSPALSQLLPAFEAECSCKVEVMVGASGTLYQQIRLGAPYDLFLAADTLYPALLYEMGVGQSPPQSYATGTLCLWAQIPLDSSRGLAQLSSPTFQRIAIAQPDVAPYGAAAEQSLQQAQLWEALRPKIVMGQSLAQVDQLIASGQVQAGFTSKASLLQIQTGYSLPIPTAPLVQHLIYLRPHPQAQAFCDYLLSPAVQAQILALGYK